MPDGAAAANGSAYLVSQLVDGDHLTTSSYLDYGLTADTALALASTNDQDAALARITGYLRAHVADYADPAGKAKDYPGPFSGAVAKLALVAEVTGQDPHSFGGYDLLQVLIDNVCTAPDSSGGYLCTAPGDFTQAYSTISQALGVLALARAGVTPPAAAVARLEQLQCSDGGFTSTLITAGGTCTSDTDATGYAAQALNLVPGAAAAVTAARGYLLNAQQSDGGFLGASGENTNSTGLGGQALQAIGTTAPVITQSKDGAQLAPHAVPAGTDPLAAARAFLLAQQLGNGGFQIGAAQPGVADARASSQAVPLLAGATLAGLSDPVTPVTPPVTAPSSGGSSAAGAPSGGLAHSTAPAPSTQATDPAATAALANTGSSARAPLGWALGLIALGVLAMLLGRRRIKVPVPASRRRH
ncbi:MAG TPA: hypothetical protein VHO01_01095 [Jatrophihabitans sp.]|nr:hypothetical protein [Jatrophihabitans sp.]